MPGRTITPELLSGWSGDATSAPGRTQLTNKFRNSMKKALAEATGEDESAFDFRSLNSSAQTTRASAESMEARGRSGRANKTWVFLGRVSEKELQIAETLRTKLASCSAVVLFSKANAWEPYAIMYRPEKKALRDKLCEAMEFDIAKSVELSPPEAAEAQEGGGVEGSQEIFLEESALEDMLRNLRRKKSIVVTGPPGTGKTFVAEELAKRIMSSAEKGSLTKIQFHPSYAYEDFVRGWRPSKEGFAVMDGVLVKLAVEATEDAESQHVLMIDEINRANVSKVFGELLSLVEATKRGPKHAVRLSYQREADDDTEETPFYLPENVYIIGTMNTADRSIAMVDFALRRRFSFFYLSPAFSSDKFHDLLVASGLPAPFVAKLRQVMNELNQTIVESGELGRGYEIGHSYFVPSGPVSNPKQWLLDIVESELSPLFSEYWFEDESVANEWSGRLRSLVDLVPATEAATMLEEAVPARPEGAVKQADPLTK